MVVAIYEPPQECSRDHVRIIPDENEGRVDAVAKGLGLIRVGWIFTDLVSVSSGQGVKHFRNIDSHFLSSQECIMAGYFQNKFANVTKLSSSGKHGSKFVTVCVTGDANRSIHMEGYQVSVFFIDRELRFKALKVYMLLPLFHRFTLKSQDLERSLWSISIRNRVFFKLKMISRFCDF